MNTTPIVFSSTTRESINRNPGGHDAECIRLGHADLLCLGECRDSVRLEDPAPWVNGAGHRLSDRRGSFYPDSYHFAPLPRSRASTNPILAEFRRDRFDGTPGKEDPRWWLGVTAEGRFPGAWPEHVAHARKVFQRLAALAVVEA